MSEGIGAGVSPCITSRGSPYSCLQAEEKAAHRALDTWDGLSNSYVLIHRESAPHTAQHAPSKPVHADALVGGRGCVEQVPAPKAARPPERTS